MINSRQKGAAFERLVARSLHEELGVQFERDLDQYRKNDRGDLLPVDCDFPFLIECKKSARPSFLASWWTQATNAAKAQNKMPVVIYRFDNHANIHAAMYLTDLANCVTGQSRPRTNDLMAHVTLAGFCYAAREAMG